MQVGELFIKINLDTAKLQTDLNGIEAKLKQLGGSLSDLAKVKGFSDITANSKELKNALGAAIPVAQQLKARLQEQQTQYGILGARLADVSQKYGATSKQAQTLELAMQKMSNNITATTAALNMIAVAADKADKEIEEIGKSADDSGEKAKGFGASIKDALSVAGGMLLAQGIAAIGSAITGAVSTAIDFEHALSGVAAVAGGLTGPQLDVLKQKALEVGATTSLSASQAVLAMENLVANGIDPTISSFGGIVDATVALAEATGSDLPTAANVATDVIQNFKGAGDDLTGVINGITGVTVAGKFDINDYALALANGGVATAGYGVELKDFNAVIAATSASFKSGQTAGTSFRVFIERLTPVGESASKAMRELGLITADGTNTFYDANGALKDQTEIFAILESKFGPLTEEMRTMYAEQIFGADGANFLTAALRVGSQGLEEYAANIEKVSAAEQAKTRLDNFAGAVEALKGAFETVSIVIAGPLLSALTPLVSTIADAVGVFGMFANSVLSAENPLQALLASIDSVIPGFQDLANQAFAWGANIVTQFSNGIMSYIAPLIQALQYIGSVIRSWLMPGSPPKIVPDLDKWGADAATVYYEGWSQGDYSALDTIGKNIQTTLKGMIEAGKSSMGEEGIIPTLMGSQDAIAAAISQLRETGSVGEESIQAIVSAAGDAGPQIEGLVRAYFDLEEASQAVADAQEELNSVTEEYSARLDPLNDQLDAINDQQKAIKDAEKLAKLNEVLADEKSTDAEKANAQLEIQKMGIEAQIRATEEEKDVAVEAAETKLDAAKEAEDQAKSAYQAQQAQLSFYNEQNSLIKQQTDLLQKLADQAAKSSGGGGGGLKLPTGGGMGGGLPALALPEIPENPLGTLVEDANNVKQSFLDMKNGIAESMQAVQTSVAPVITFIQDIATKVQTYLVPIGTYIRDTFVPPLTVVGSFIQSNLMPLFSQFADRIMQAFSGEGTSAITLFGGAIQAVGGWFITIQPAVQGLIALIGVTLMNALAGLMGLISGALPGALQVFGGIWQTLGGIITIITGIVQTIGGVFTALANNDMPALQTALLSGWETIKSGVTTTLQGMGEIILGIASFIAGGVIGFFEGIYNSVTGSTSNLVSDTLGFLQKLEDGMLAGAKAIFDGVVQWFADLYQQIVGGSIIPDLVTDVLAEITNLADTFIELVQGLYDGAIEWFETLKTDAINAITTLATDIGNQAATFATSAGKLGTALVDGVVNYVKSGAGRLADAVANMIKNAIGAGEDAADSHSPSRETRDRLGIPLVQGIIVGVQKMVPALLKLSKDMTQDFIDTSVKKLADLEKAYTTVVRDIFKGVQSSIMSFNDSMIDSIAGFAELGPQQNKEILDTAKELQEKLQDIRDKYASDETNPELIKERDEALQAVNDEIALNDEKARRLETLTKEQTNLQLYAQQQIAAAQEEYLKQREKDPIGAAKMFEARKNQILELAKLDLELFKAQEDQDVVKRDMIGAQRKYLEENGFIAIQMIEDQIKAESEARAQQLTDLQATAREIEKVFTEADMGKNIVGGIAQGIRNQAAQISGALTEAMKQAIVDLRAYLGIHSPSKLFAQQVAMPSMMGWVQGVEMGADNLNRAFVDAGSLSLQSATMGMGSSQTGARGMSGDTYHISLDLRGSTLSRNEVETVLDRKLHEIATTAKRLKKG